MLDVVLETLAAVAVLTSVIGFTQAAAGKHAIACILWSDEDDVEIASQCAMLESVIEKVDLRAEFVFGEAACFETAFAEDDGNAEPA